MRHLIAFACLLPCAAWAQTAVVRVTPTGGNIAITTTPSALIPAIPLSAASTYALRYQVQGTGYACVSWVTAAITISGNTGAATCGGAGAFLVYGLSADARVAPAALPTTALYGVAATGATLNLSYEVE